MELKNLQRGNEIQSELKNIESKTFKLNRVLCFLDFYQRNKDVKINITIDPPKDFKDAEALLFDLNESGVSYNDETRGKVKSISIDIDFDSQKLIALNKISLLKKETSKLQAEFDEL